MNLEENEDKNMPSIIEVNDVAQNFTEGVDDIVGSMSILIVGKIGSGKSTLVNSLLGRKVAKEKLGASSQEHDLIELHKVNIGGVDLSLYDTRGLGDPKLPNKKFTEHLRHGSGIPSEFDLVLICVKMGERIDDATIQSITSLSRVFSDNFWRRSIFLLTFTNHFELQRKDDDDDIDDRTLAEMISRHTKILADELRKNLGVPPDLFDTIPFCNVGRVRKGKEEKDKKLTTSKNWVNDVLVCCVARCSENCKGSMSLVAQKCIFTSAVVTGGSIAIGATIGGIIGGVVGSLFFPGLGTVGGAAAGAQWGGGIVGATGGLGSAAAAIGELRNYFKEITGNKLCVQNY